MGKRSATFALMLPPREAGTSLSRWLCSALRTEILEGRLAPGARLPATRDLSRQYGLSRGTIVGAFEQLKSEGYVEGSVGSGTYVSRVLPDDLLQVTHEATAQPSVAQRGRRRVSSYARRVKLFPGFPSRPLRAFRTDQPALELFPTTLWAQLAGRRLRRATANLLLGGGAMGYRPLQEAVADYLTTSRGVKCAAEQIAIVSGTQEALDLCARLFLDPGDRVCMEDPGYPGAALVFEAFGARISAVRVDEEGMRTPGSNLRGVRLAYVTPGHQFPTCVGMSLRRRLALLEWARSTGALIFEDDYDSEYRYAGRPMPALQGLDRHGCVLFVGSFSKVLFPSLRLGYLVVPPDLVDLVDATLSVTRRHVPLLEQALLCDFITEGHFGRHVRRMREVYAERLSVLMESAKQRLTGLLEISGVEAGLQTVGWLCDGVDEAEAVQAAARREVEVTAVSRYSRGKVTREGLQLGFAAVSAEEIRRGVRELAAALEGVLSRPRAPGAS
ncbi:MocR-like pyridoxine biosynthesis transcription factor PdxR [Hyalangium versicolor]|uniref:MocR-like pyridoxine biosynthesis transcription factor PdxR n=1 Tax=Hyalangium versicolor TaxID=2861190 RepID=UPI001CCCBC79|nr:PLP-dependent aminotransferase family protein [Hyalangium versicolor]